MKLRARKTLVTTLRINTICRQRPQDIAELIDFLSKDEDKKKEYGRSYVGKGSRTHFVFTIRSNSTRMFKKCKRTYNRARKSVGADRKANPPLETRKFVLRRK